MRRWRNLTSPKTILAISRHGATNAWLLATSEGLWRYAAGADACEPIAEPLKGALLTAVAAHGDAALDPAGSLILVGASDGIAYSSDGGASWTAGALHEPAQIAQIVLSPDFDRDGIAFAATTSHGLLRSTDGGRSWVYRNFGLPDSEVTADRARGAAACRHCVCAERGDRWQRDARPVSLHQPRRKLAQAQRV
jgi:photosystem II stability/assembly factor-like uncharacterized protein